MIILAVEGSGSAAGVSILDDGKVIAEYLLNDKKTHSQTLLPMIEEVTRFAQVEPSNVDYIAVTNGPGSFTGLRIAISTVKGLAYALNKPVVAVNTLESLAFNFEGDKRVICPILDARRGQVYTGAFEFIDGKLNTIISSEAVSIDEIIDDLNKLGREVVFLGDGVLVHRSHIDELLKVEHSFAPAPLLYQKASSLGRSAITKIEEGYVTDSINLTADYLRLSQAEREKIEKGETMELVRMSEEFIDEISALESEYFSEPWSREGFMEAISKDVYRAYMLLRKPADEMIKAGNTEAGGSFAKKELMGYLVLNIACGEGEITNVAIKKECRRMGAGEVLMRRVIEEEKNSGTTRLVLEVRESNQAARGLYTKVGFKEDGIRKNFYNKPNEDAVCMSMEL